VRLVELRGDLVHWTHPLPLEPLPGGGELGATVALATGTYGYKFRLDDGTWELDPANPRTRAVDGTVNSLLVVGGTDEPVLHAPAAPWLVRSADGLTVVRAGLRRGAGDRLALRWREGDGAFHDVPLLPVADEDQHVLFEAVLPASAGDAEYLFVLPDGRPIGANGGAGQAFPLGPHPRARPAPAWWREAVLYTVFLDRFRAAGRGGAWPPLGEGALPEDSHGGDLAGVVEALGHLVDLGVTVLHLTPVALSASAHRYDAIDPRSVDPRLGGEAALRRLLDAAHEAGLHVLFDVTLTHVHRDFAPFRTVCEQGPASPYWDWFRPHRFPFVEGPPDPGYEHYQKGQWQEPLLRTEHPEVQDFLVETFERWTRFGADGFRLDAVADVPLALARRIAGAVRAIRADAVLYGELIADNGHRWTEDADGLDAVLEIVGQDALRGWLTGAGPGAARVAAVLARRRVARAGRGDRHVACTATHDQGRLASVARDRRAARIGALLALVGPSVPAILYGDEVGLTSSAPPADFEGAWPDRMPMPWESSAWDPELLALHRATIRLRRERAVLSRGDDEWRALGDGDDVLFLRRRLGDEAVDVLVHAGEGERVIELPGDAASGAEILCRAGDAAVEGAVVRLGPWSGVALDRRLPESLVAVVRGAADRADELAARAFDEGLLEVPALPPRLYCTVTEACNLRCVHCITHAPERTRERRARTMAPWLVERLAEPFAAARYVGFSHGGESMFAPVFFDVLAALRRARAGRPGRTDAHLLTNGMLLEPETLRRLLDLGVTSLAVSLDGADAPTNDAIRLGGRFDTIVANVREATRLRSARGLDLRIGISTVVGRTNVAALARLGRLAVDLGVDWLKVEETWPANPWARRDALAPADGTVRDAFAALRAVVAGSSLVLVDHLAPPGGCDCGELPEALRAFREADDFANRARFRVCRMAWEQASVDPDGTVRPIDYDHESLGSLLDASLLELWNGDAARSLRAGVLAAHRRRTRTA